MLPSELGAARRPQPPKLKAAPAAAVTTTTSNGLARQATSAARRTVQVPQAPGQENWADDRHARSVSG